MKTIKNIQPKPYKKFGEIHHPTEPNVYHADITSKKSIRLYGTMYDAEIIHQDDPDAIEWFLNVYPTRGLAVFTLQ